MQVPPLAAAATAAASPTPAGDSRGTGTGNTGAAERPMRVSFENGNTSAKSSSSQAAHPPIARLRIEYFSNKEARLLSWFVYLATLALLLATLALVLFKFLGSESDILFHDTGWYIGNLVVAACGMLGLLGLAAWYCMNLYLTRESRKNWSFRRMALCRDAGIMLAIQILSTAFWVAPYALTTQRVCVWFESEIGWLAMMRWTCYNCTLLWAVMMAHACNRYRGPNPPSDPDEQLVMDIKPHQKLRLHAPKALLWVAFQVMVVVGTSTRIQDINTAVKDGAGCADYIYICELQDSGKVVSLVEVLFVFMYTVAYSFYLYRAFADHALLPFSRYRLSNMYIRLVSRHATVAFVTVTFSLILIKTVRFNSCWSYLDGSLGIAPVQLAISVLVTVQVVALMPKLHTEAIPTTCVQEFSWTQAGLPAAIARRDRQLHPEQGRWQGLQRFLSGGWRIMAQAAQAAQEVPGKLERDIAGRVLNRSRSHHSDLPTHRPAQQEQQGHAAAVQQLQRQRQPSQQQQGPPEANLWRSISSPASRMLRSISTLPRRGLQRLGTLGRRASSEPPSEPMFCVELALRLFYWSNFCYSYWLPEEGGMSHAFAKELFELEGFESLVDQESDTRALLSWRDGVVLLAFRGTASRANAVTDLKLWQTPLLPKRHYHGRLVKVHAGFYQAYTANDDRQKVQNRITEIVNGFSEGAGLCFYLTGHSLGGALAVLAAYDLKRLYPQATVTLYTFGAPRVGNRAFAAEYRSLVPDSWQVVNDQDPVPRVPTTGFEHGGQPVIINAAGDLIVRPSFFERNVMQRSGGVLTHHYTNKYALSLAAVIKSQFSSSKQLAGGEAGVTALAGVLDLGQALLLMHMDLRSLQDPAIQPEPMEMPGSRSRSGSNRSMRGAVQRASSRLLSCCSGLPTSEGAAREQADTGEFVVVAEEVAVDVDLLEGGGQEKLSGADDGGDNGKDGGDGEDCGKNSGDGTNGGGANGSGSRTARSAAALAASEAAS